MTQQRTFPENVSQPTARDTLGKLLFTLPVSDRAADTAPEIMVLCDEAAEAILENGYRPPVRTIITVAELDALPEGAVIRDNDGDVFEAVRCTGDEAAGVPDYNCWDQIAETWPMDSDKIALPAVVLDEADS